MTEKGECTNLAAKRSHMGALAQYNRIRLDVACLGAHVFAHIDLGQDFDSVLFTVRLFDQFGVFYHDD